MHHGGERSFCGISPKATSPQKADASMNYLLQRRSTLAQLMKAKGVDGFLVTTPVNVTYLTDADYNEWAAQHRPRRNQ